MFLKYLKIAILSILLLACILLFLIIAELSVWVAVIFYGLVIGFMLWGARDATLCYFGITILLIFGFVFLYLYFYLSAIQLSFCFRYDFSNPIATICIFVRLTRESSLICLAFTVLIFFIGFFTLDYLTDSRRLADFVFCSLGFLCSITLFTCTCDLLSTALLWGALNFFMRRLLVFYTYASPRHQVFIRNFLRLARVADCCLYGALIYLFFISGTTLFFWTIHNAGYVCYLQHRAGIMVVCAVIIAVACFKNIHVFLINYMMPSLNFSVAAALFISAACAALSGTVLILHLNFLWYYHPLLQQLLCTACLTCSSMTLLAALRQPTLKQFFSCVAFYQLSYFLADACACGCTFLFFQSVFYIFIKVALIVLSGWLVHICDVTTLSYQTSTPGFYSIIYFSFYYIVLCGVAAAPCAATLYFKGLFLIQTPVNIAGFYLICCVLVFNFIILIRCLTKLNDMLCRRLGEKKQANHASAARVQQFYVLNAVRNYAFVCSPTFWLQRAVACNIFFLALSCCLHFLCVAGLLELPFLWFLSTPGMLFITFFWWLFL